MSGCTKVTNLIAASTSDADADNDALKVIIVDDELLAREGLHRRLQQFTNIRIVAVCQTGKEALEVILHTKVDAIFLDIEMPGMTGLELLEELQKTCLSLPFIIFTTAYQDFALRAFDFEPCDYLLKPLEQNRLSRCVARLQQFFDMRSLAQRTERLEGLLSRKTGTTLKAFIHSLEDSARYQTADLDKLVSFKVGTEWVKLAMQDIYWVEAAGDYMCLHLEDKQHIIRKTMKQLEQELNPNMFPRVNRSAIVNIHKVEKLTPNSNGEYHAHLSSGMTVKVSRKYKFKLAELRAS